MSARGTPLEDRHLLSAVELRAVLVRALEQLAPIGGAREIPFNAYCDCLLGLLADFLAASPQPESADELERLVALLRDKLAAAMTERGRRGRTCGMTMRAARSGMT